MATHKASISKKVLSPTATKRKSTSKAKKHVLVSQPTKPKRKPIIARGWEEGEDQLVVTLRNDGKTYAQISQHLPGRSVRACETRYSNLRARSQNDGAKQKDALASVAPRREYWSKEWEDWEDLIIVTHRNAGELWENITKMLPSRTVGSVRTRWQRVLKSRSKATVVPQAQSSSTPSIPTPVKTFIRWTKGEDQLLKSLHESGKGWAEIGTHFPNRSWKSCQNRWHKRLHGRQGPAKIWRQWEEWEERLLVSGCYAGLHWKEIAKSISGRTQTGSKIHWREYFFASDQDEPWTTEELALLLCLRREGSDWDEISQELPGHTTNACRTQWYKETEGIQGPTCQRRVYDTWSAEEVDVLIALYNTIGPRWQEICTHIPGRTEEACRYWFQNKCTKADGVGGAPSEYWKEFFNSKLHPGNLDLPPWCFKLIA